MFVLFLTRKPLLCHTMRKLHKKLRQRPFQWGLRDEKSGKYIIKYFSEINIDLEMTDEQAVLEMNKNIEKLLDGYEYQYYWVHRRFKTRPEGESPLYSETPSQIRRRKKKLRKAKQVQKDNVE